MVSKYVGAQGSAALRKVLWEWVYLVETISRRWDWEDCAWWYTERALIGTLAAATWYARGMALEEYSNIKGRGDDRYMGRCDLYMNIGRLHFVVEGKLRWCPIGSTAREGAAGIRRALVAACNDVRRLKGYGERRLGVVFAVPSLPWAQREKTHSLIAEWLEKIRVVPADGLAWTFPRSTRQLAAENGRIYPGVVLLMRGAR